MSQPGYTVVLQNLDLSPGNLAVVENESYRVGLLKASGVFLKKPLVQALGDHEVVGRLQHLSQQPRLTAADAADSLRYIEAVQAALHEAAHHATAFAVTHAEDVLLKGSRFSTERANLVISSRVRPPFVP